MKQRKIIIDASSCIVTTNRPFPSGIGRTTLELIRALEQIPDLPFELGLFAQRVHNDRLQRYCFKSKQYNLPLPQSSWVENLKNHFPIVEMLTTADIFHNPANSGGFFCGKRTILTIHDAMMFMMPEDAHFSSKDLAFYRRAAERCCAILTCSLSSKNDLLRYIDIPEEKITVVPWGYDDTVFFQKNKNTVRLAVQEKFHLGDPYLFTVSCSIGRKRTPQLIQQYLDCAAKGYPYDLVVVWRHVPNEVMELLSSNPCGNRVKIIPGVSNDDLSLLYSGATCTIFPSLYEGFGLPLLESMACGTPVLTTKISSMPEVVGDAGIYLDSLEDSEIGEKLIALAENKWDLNALSQKSLKRASRFSWERCAKETIAVYLKHL